MGGSAFGSGPDAPFTPRMPSAIYNRVRDECHSKLRKLFLYVATPIPGPAKQDHGDIDVLVAVERATIFPSTTGSVSPRTEKELLEAIRQDLDAEYAIFTGPTANLAIPWPSEANQGSEGDSRMAGIDNGEPAGQSDTKKKHIQVDVRICIDIDQLCWACQPHPHLIAWPSSNTCLAGPLQARPRRYLEPNRQHDPPVRPHR